MFLEQNIRPGWKGLPSINALAYLANSSVMAKKNIITLTPGGLRLAVLAPTRKKYKQGSILF
jgi:hypothetical protein